MTDERAVSEVIAFVLVFAIILGSVGLLYTAGFDSMRGYQEAEQLRNAERAMSALGQNVNDVQRAGIHERSAELELRGGRVGIDGNGTTLDVTIDGESEEIHTGAIRYERGGTHISYEAGGIFSGDVAAPARSVVVDQPTLTCNPERATAVISLLELRGEDGDRAISGESGVELTIVERETEAETHGADDVTVDVVDSAFEGGWEDALDRNGWDDGSCDVSTVTIRTVTADVEF